MIYRHSLLVRITHWINLPCLIILLLSGFGIFNGWPALYWGIRTNFSQPLLAMYAVEDRSGRTQGITELFGHRFITTGWFGLSHGMHGVPIERGFPAWATLPAPLSLAMARRWHFFFAWIFVINGVVYALASLLGGHLRRGLIPSRQQLRGIGRSIWDHARLRFPKGNEARQYNILQKLSYLIVVFGLGPLAVLTGLAMSPWLDAAYPPLVEVFGGRQSARTLHFVIAFAFLAFALVHIAMVLLSGAWNNLRAMVTGWYRPGGETGGSSDARDGP